jgi:hypothetical protein
MTRPLTVTGWDALRGALELVLVVEPVVVPVVDVPEVDPVPVVDVV